MKALRALSLTHSYCPRVNPNKGRRMEISLYIVLYDAAITLSKNPRNMRPDGDSVPQARQGAVLTAFKEVLGTIPRHQSSDLSRCKGFGLPRERMATDDRFYWKSPRLRMVGTRHLKEEV